MLIRLMCRLPRNRSKINRETKIAVKSEETTPSWPAVLAATYPPASVSGAPKLAALEVIRRLEPVPRGPYCGAFGWIDADTGRAELAVAIRIPVRI